MMKIKISYKTKNKPQANKQTILHTGGLMIYSYDIWSNNTHINTVLYSLPIKVKQCDN